MQTLVSSSFSSRSRRWREVTNVPSRPANGDVFTVKVMAMVGSSIVDLGQRRGRLRMGDGFADGDAFDTGDGQHVARPAFGLFHPVQPFERVQLGDAGFLQRAVQLADAHLVAQVQRAVEDAADGQAAQVVAVVEVGHLQLQHAVRIAGRAGAVLQDGFKQRLQIRGWIFQGSLARCRPWRWRR